MNGDEFYVGYVDTMPPGLVRHARRWLAGLAVAVVATGVALALSLGRPAPGTFEYRVERRFEGVLRLRPIAHLERVRADGSVESVPLVGMGKHAVPEPVPARDGEAVAVTGSWIGRDDLGMIEVASIGPASGPAPAPRGGARAAGVRAEVSGELVDTKCWLGVMRPGGGKVHRGCAVRCLSGGVPAGIATPDASGRDRLVYLAPGPDGRPGWDPAWAGLPVRATGLLAEDGGMRVLTVESLAPLPAP